MITESMSVKTNIKYLITSGCSFSQVPNADVTWPVHLGKLLNCEVDYNGRGAAGNGIISRSIVYAVTNALQKYKPEEILVGVMWSGYDRLDYYHRNPPLKYCEINSGNPYYTNPQFIADDFNYILINKHWDDESTHTYFKNFYNDEYAIILTLEHILRVEWLLKSYNIPYFMTTYAGDVLPIGNNKRFLTNKDIEYLYNMIDFKNWLSVLNMDQWALTSGLKYSRPPDTHPSTEMHEVYTKNIIVPHLKFKNFIKD